MNDKRATAERLLGHIEWQSPVEGLCLCPGEGKHTQRTGMRDCKVQVSGIPTVHCFHTSCGAEVAAANKELRRALWNDRWELQLPGGGSVSGLASNRGAIDTGVDPALTAAEAVARRVKAWEAELPGILERHRWPAAQIERESPRSIRRSDPYSQFSQWLCLWGEEDIIWIGDVHDSGHHYHGRHFRPVSEWRRIGPVLGNYTCGSCFAAGTFTRSKVTTMARRFLVVESDVLTKDEVGAVFRFMRVVLKFPLLAVVDTAGKSLHAWFPTPRTAERELALKHCLTGLKCDPRMFSATQPARVPGAYRDGKLQRLLYTV